MEQRTMNNNTEKQRRLGCSKYFVRDVQSSKFKVQSSAKSGFTLVEMVIYVGFFAVLSLVAVNGTILSMKAFYSLRITQNIGQSGTTAMERMALEVRNAYDIDTANSTLNSNPGRLTLRTKDAVGNNTTVEFYVDAASQVGMKVGGVDKGQLVTKTVTVPNLIFRSISNTNSKAIKIEMTLNESHQDMSKTMKFYDTIVMRGSMH